MSNSMSSADTTRNQSSETQPQLDATTLEQSRETNCDFCGAAPAAQGGVLCATCRKDLSLWVQAFSTRFGR